MSLNMHRVTQEVRGEQLRALDRALNQARRVLAEAQDEEERARVQKRLANLSEERQAWEETGTPDDEHTARILAALSDAGKELRMMLGARVRPQAWINLSAAAGIRMSVRVSASAVISVDDNDITLYSDTNLARDQVIVSSTEGLSMVWVPPQDMSINEKLLYIQLRDKGASIDEALLAVNDNTLLTQQVHTQQAKPRQAPTRSRAGTGRSR